MNIPELLPIKINGKNSRCLQFETEHGILGSIPVFSTHDICFQGQENCFCFIEEIYEEGLCMGIDKIMSAFSIIQN